MLTLYSKTICGFCVQAKSLLKSYSIPFEEINIEDNENLRSYLKNKGLRTVPQFFIQDEHVFNGFTDLSSHSREEILAKIGEYDANKSRVG